jgi:outer membrane murein-binding lipoprotein Lpp
MKLLQSRLLTGLVALLLIAGAVRTQEKANTDKELNLRAYTEFLRADVKAKRVGIVTEIMKFDDTEAAAFWPIFREYDLELSKIGDGRISLIEDYIKNYEDITDQKADQLMTQAFTLESQRAELKKKYFDKMKKTISPVTAARFFQIENQIQQIVDLQISASLPTMQQVSK